MTRRAQHDPEHYDALETRAPAAREAELAARLPALVALAKEKSAHYARALADIDPREIDGRDALIRLPVLRKADLPEAMRAAPPFGGLNLVPPGRMRRVFASPGPIYEAEAKRADFWRTARALYASGFRSGDLIHNCFAYHFTPAGAMFEAGAFALGCAVFPAGPGATEQQARAMADLQPRGYVGTPDFLKIVLEKADEQGLDVASLERAHVTGGAFPPSLQSWYAARGIDAYQSYGIADLGMIAYETPARDGLVVDEEILVEIVRPGTGDPVAAGEVGEVLVTCFSPALPLIRFATGDLSAVLPGSSPCGRTNMRIKGWLGRADQSVKVKGIFVHPLQIADVARRHPEIARCRLIVARRDERDEMVLHVECASASAPVEAIAQSLHDVTKLRGEVRLAAPGSLPDDGKIIEDARSPAG